MKMVMRARWLLEKSIDQGQSVGIEGEVKRRGFRENLWLNMIEQ